jgi:tRNA-dihydrouridine synthase B
MDGITDSAYRRLVRSFAADVVLFSEFTSADGFLRSERVRQRLAFAPEEHPYFVQLFGNDPQAFREAALALEQQGVAGVDVNMGCPARKIVHSQHGSGLMRDVNQACRIVEAIANACRVEVSVKTRLGWNSPEGLVPFASSLVDAGASLLTIHGRTYDQAFRGQADWEPIYALKRRLSVPVLGNGDVQSRSDGLARLGNLDGFMIGRAAIGNPWAFLPGTGQGTAHGAGAGSGAAAATAPGASAPSARERVAVILRHYALMREERPERQALIEIRRHLVGYLRGFQLARQARRTLLEIDTEATLKERLLALAEHPGHLAALAEAPAEAGADLAKAS